MRLLVLIYLNEIILSPSANGQNQPLAKYRWTAGLYIKADIHK